MRSLLAFSFATAFVFACSTEAPIGQTDINVERYDFELDLGTRAAVSTLTIHTTDDGDCFTLPFRASELSGLTIDGDDAVFSKDNEPNLQICGEGWRAGSELTLSGSMKVPDQTWEDSQVGFSTRQDRAGNPFHYLVSWVGGCDRFGPCDNTPSAFAKYNFTVNHDAGTSVLCPGEITAGDTTTTCSFAHDGGPTYSTFGLAASPSWQYHDLGNWSDIKVSLYDIPDTQIAESLDIDQHKDFLAFMIDTFGAYPYGDELRFVAGPTYWQGFEHPGNIVLSQSLAMPINSRYADPLAHTTNHEIAHQWAGDETTLASTYDFVWKEAMAEYLTFIHEETVNAQDAAKTPAAWKYFSSNSGYYLVPGEKPPLLTYYGHVYGPGPMIFFRQLESMYSREKVLAALQLVLGEQRALSVDDVKSALEQTLEVDLTDYFDDWVYGEGKPTRPTYDVSVQTSGNDITVSAEQVAPQSISLGCAFTIQLVSSTGQTLDVKLSSGVSGDLPMTQTINAAGFDFQTYVFDPYNECLAYQSTSNLTGQQAPVNPWLSADAHQHAH